MKIDETFFSLCSLKTMCPLPAFFLERSTSKLFPSIAAPNHSQVPPQIKSLHLGHWCCIYILYLPLSSIHFFEDILWNAVSREVHNCKARQIGRQLQGLHGNGKINGSQDLHISGVYTLNLLTMKRQHSIVLCTFASLGDFFELEDNNSAKFGKYMKYKFTRSSWWSYWWLSKFLKFRALYTIGVLLQLSGIWKIHVHLLRTIRRITKPVKWKVNVEANRHPGFISKVEFHFLWFQQSYWFCKWK